MAGMSENLKLLGEYSKAMEAGDEEAVFSFFAPEFTSHVTARVNPDAIGTDIRGEELRWGTEVRSAFPDMVFSVDLLIESDDLVVSNWTVRARIRHAVLRARRSGKAVEITALGSSHSATANRRPGADLPGQDGFGSS